MGGEQANDARMVRLIGIARRGREAKQTLTARWARIPTTALRTRCDSFLTACCKLLKRTGREAEARGLEQTLTCSDSSVLELFHRFVGGIADGILTSVTRDLAPLSSGQGPEVARLARQCQEGLQAENELAGELRESLRAQGAKHSAGMPSSQDVSDVAQDATVKLLEWLVTSFRGVTDAEVGQAVRVAISREVGDAGRRAAARATRPLGGDEPGREEDPSQRPERDDARARANQVIDSHGEADRMLFRLRRLKNFSEAELEELLGGGSAAYEIRNRIKAIEIDLLSALGSPGARSQPGSNQKGQVDE
jgi:DNA-directed RNA polymerase specialized sigma24 family protein